MGSFGKLRLAAASFFISFLLVGGGASRAGAEPVRKIVTFQTQAVNQAAHAALIKAHGGVVLKDLPLVNAMAVMVPEKALASLERHWDVLRVEDDALVSIVGKPDKARGGGKPKQNKEQPPQVLPWGVNRIDAEHAWGAGYDGEGVKVAVIDTGVDYRHPDLADNCKGGYNAIMPFKDYRDDHGHGTHVSGIVAASNNAVGVSGVAPRAWLYGVKALNKKGAGNTSDIIDALDWCIREGVQVVNMSLGGSTYVWAFENACRAAYEAGVVLVAAAGNNGGSVLYPAAYDTVIAVAATYANDTAPSWSNHGPEIDLAAPGVQILSTWKGGEYQTASGTSMASPHVAGTIALKLSADIYGTADDILTPGYDIYTGYGLVDAGEAATGTPNYGDDLIK